MDLDTFCSVSCLKASPELAPQGADLPGHGVGRLADVVQVSLQLPAVGVGPLRLLLRLLQLPLQLLHARVQLVGLEGRGRVNTDVNTGPPHGMGVQVFRYVVSGYGVSWGTLSLGLGGQASV